MNIYINTYIYMNIHTHRSRSDTYYLDDARLLRSHMTAHQTTLLRQGRR